MGADPLGHVGPALHGTEDGGQRPVYLLPLSKNGQVFYSLSVKKIPPVFLPVQAWCKLHRTAFPLSAAPAGINVVDSTGEMDPGILFEE